jgi:hypothetical protein
MQGAVLLAPPARRADVIVDECFRHRFELLAATLTYLAPI